MEAQVENLTLQISQRDEMIAVMKSKTKEFVAKLRSDNEEAVAKVCYLLFVLLKFHTDYDQYN